MKKYFIYNKFIIKQKNFNNKEKINTICDISFNNVSNILIKKGIGISYKFEGDESIKIFGDEFVRNNKNKCYILNSGKKYKLAEYFNVKNNHKSVIKIRLIGINHFISLKKMFFKCNSLISIKGFSNWNTNKVNDMSFLFYGCSSLTYFFGIENFNTSKVKDMSFLFTGCISLIYLTNISKWNTNNVTCMNLLFSNCLSLKSLPDI